MIITPGKNIIVPEQRFIMPEDMIARPHAVGAAYSLDSLLETRKSSIHGLGLFAKRRIRRHEVIWHEELNGRYRPEDEGPLRWTNHSYDPNASLVLQHAAGAAPALSLIAIKQISAGDEVLYNYDAFGHTGYKTACNCAATDCIGSFVLRTEWGERR